MTASGSTPAPGSSLPAYDPTAVAASSPEPEVMALFQSRTLLSELGAPPPKKPIPPDCPEYCAVTSLPSIWRPPGRRRAYGELLPLQMPLHMGRGARGGAILRNRYLEATPGPGIRLFPGRENQLRRRPADGEPDLGHRAVGPDYSAREPRLPLPHGPLPGGGGRHPAVPR